ncbi:hypothetical protein F2Q68_00020891 [Brassica cretica]|uniref:Uncharacterized protein n=1 Tax=Brassica cretica TaxID=69181 RepID=A0A8S9FT15_BRACR|nr:hypothetical protein F2Q68_00020891 [Brassica cretica]
MKKKGDAGQLAGNPSISISISDQLRLFACSSFLQSSAKERSSIPIAPIHLNYGPDLQSLFQTSDLDLRGNSS